MRRKISVALLGIILWGIHASAESAELLPFKLASRADQSEIQRFRGGGKDHLAFEVLLENYHGKPLHFEKVQMKVMQAGKILQEQEVAGKALSESFSTVQGPYLKEQDPVLAAGGAAILFLWLDLPENLGPGDQVETQFVVEEVGNPSSRMTLVGPAISISGKAPVVVSPPLQGKLWWTPNGPDNRSIHRRILVPLSAHLWGPERYAVDWIQMGQDGKSYSGPADKNTSYHAYGHPVLSAVAGKVVKIKDGILENVPNAKTMAVPITLDTIGGNHVIVDIGGGLFAFYAHLQPGSISVKLGDMVKAGQTLGLLGNSGNSSEPHLHFHVIDHPDPLLGQGVPYALDRWVKLGGEIRVDAEGDPVALSLTGKNTEQKNQTYMNLDLAEFP